jgi:hypothetical protein
MRAAGDLVRFKEVGSTFYCSARWAPFVAARPGVDVEDPLPLVADLARALEERVGSDLVSAAEIRAEGWAPGIIEASDVQLIRIDGEGFFGRAVLIDKIKTKQSRGKSLEA